MDTSTLKASATSTLKASAMSTLEDSPNATTDTEATGIAQPKTPVSKIVNHLKSNTDQIQRLNNSIPKAQNTDENKERVENRLPKLKINLQNFDQSQLVNDLSKVKSPIDDKNSSELVFTHQKDDRECFPVASKQKQPIMGRAALLKKANIDSDSLVIRGMILNKYENVINHYVSRMYKRRLSRRSTSELSEDDFNESSSSSPYPVFSPTGLSPVDTPGSETRSRFEFPPVEEYRYPFFAANYYLPKRSLEFLKSTDDFNIDTATEEELNDSFVSSVTGQAVSMTNVSEYDPKAFLENALGDLSQSENCETDQEKPNKQNMGSSNVSSILSRAGSFYSSMRKNIKRRRHSMRAACLEEHQISGTSTASNELVQNLERELSIQNSIMFQISKALNYCRSSREFVSGKEHIEAEKILLVATITKEALMNEINAIEFNTYENKFDPRCSGDIRISNLVFRLKEKTSALPHHADSSEHFLAVATCGTKIISSEVLVATDNTVLVRKCFEFDKLLADFEISLSLYSMTVRNKVHIIQENMKCPSPKSMLRCTKDPRRHKSTNTTLYIEPLAFTLLGKCFVRNQELSKLGKTKDTSVLSLKLQNVPRHSSIEEQVEIKIDHGYMLTNKTSGFLTIGIENEQLFTSWNRRWCLLEGSIFNYWNYPSEEVAAPLGSFDLCYSKAQKVVPADRTICARSKTLLIPIQSGKSEKKYLLSADTSADMGMWERELNFVIQSLLIWNGMKCLPVE